MESDWIQGRCIGKGSFGTVHLAYDKHDGRVLAVKSVGFNSSKISIESLENEIEILRSLDSTYIVSYLGDSTSRQHRNLHMEYVPGGTLADAAGSLSEPQVRAYARCVARALFYLHSVAGVVHSDVKGRNVLLGPAPGSAKLADFGSAQRVSGGGPRAICGTPLWMAPEVIRGETPMPESDIWSLGCTVIEMITGGHPWKSSKLVEIGFGDGLPEFPSESSKLARDFLDKCLRRNPEERWTAEQLLQHPFMADDVGAETGRSPRSVLDRVNSEFDDGDGDDDDDSDDGDVVGLGRERIRELCGISGGIVDWDSEGWEVVRYSGEEAEAEAEAEAERTENGCDWESEASGSGLSNEMRCSGSSCSTSSCCDCKGGGIECQQVGRVRQRSCLDLCQVWLHMIVVSANPIFFTLVLQLFSFYRFHELRLLNL